MAQQSGTYSRWFLWMKRKDITDGKNILYMRRWILANVFGWKLYVHKIVRADHDRCMHDHPFRFFGFIFKGGYIEDLPDGPWQSGKVIRRTNKPFRFINRTNPKFTHRIHALLDGPSWTILIRTPTNRKWGFYTPNGWMHWKDFVKVNPLTRVLWCGTDDDDYSSQHDYTKEKEDEPVDG